MLFDLIIFAVVLVVLQTGLSLLVGFGLMKFFMSEKFIKKYTKMTMKIAEEVTEEMLDEE